MEKRVLYIGFSRNKNPFKIGSALIRYAEAPGWFEMFPASHVFAVFPAHEGRPFYMVNEAAGTMVRWISQPNFEDHAQITSLYRLEVILPIYKMIQLYGDLHAGVPYGMIENVGIAMVRLAKLLTGRTIANPFGSGDGIQKCSELIMRNIVSRITDSETIRGDLLKSRKHSLPVDIDVIGVRDIYEVIEHLADLGLCERVDINSPMRVEPDFQKAV